MVYLRSTIPILVALLITGCASLSNGPPLVQRNSSSAEYEDGFVRPSDGMHAPRSIPADASDTAATNAASNDLWQQMRDGFSLEDANHDQVRRQIGAYTRNPAQVEKVFERASPYMAYILDEVQQRGYPTSLALLPFVESGFDPFAYSHGKAAGLWQFIPGTGKLYGLKQDWWYDGRRDVVASTQAALDHLGALHDEFDGDWLLALAAYNAGSGTIQAAIDRNQRAGKPTDFWHLGLPRETTEYVPRLLAIREIVRNPERYGVTLADIEPTPAFAMVDIDGQIDLGIAAKLAGMKTGELLQLNPGFNRLATHPNGPHQLAIPVDKLDTFVDNLDNLPDEKRTHSVRHTVKHGETLSGIAAHFSTTVSSLQQSNHLRGSVIRPGQDLLVSSAVAAPNQLALLPQQRVTGRSASGTITHTVRSGESLWNISRKYDVSVRQLLAWNRLSNHSVIKPGQKLRIQGNHASAQAETRQIRTIRYTVKQGDTLYSIARKYSVTINDLRHWNKLPSSNHLLPGQRLELHINVTDVAQL
jgi:peptidoglycan lytic transglycosylase D